MISLDINQDKILNIISDLSNMTSILSSTFQVEAEFENILTKIIDLFDARNCFINMKIIIGDKPLKISKAIGLPPEQALYIIDFAKTQTLPSKVIGNAYSYQFNLSMASERQRTIKLLDIKSIVHIIIDDSISETFTLYFDRNVELLLEYEKIIVSLARLLKEAYQTRLNFKHQDDLTSLQIFGYENHIYPTYLVSADYGIIDANNEGVRLLGNPRHIAPLNLLSHISNLEVKQELITWAEDDTQKELLIVDKVELNLPAYSSYPDISVKTNIIAKKSKYKTNQEIIILSCVLRSSSDARPTYLSTLKDVPNDLFPQLNRLSEIYEDDPIFAADEAMRELFPSAVSFTVNEHTGPIILGVSPKIDRDLLFENTVRLMAGLNAEQIVEQGYITGIIPWSHPDGELRWVAFFIDNDNARGKIEIHLLGIITKSNLLMAKPEIAQVLLGTLLGAMNGHIQIIKEDGVDFSTEPYNYDRNFSSVSLIEENLTLLRRTSSEILGAYLSRR